MASFVSGQTCVTLLHRDWRAASLAVEMPPTHVVSEKVGLEASASTWPLRAFMTMAAPFGALGVTPLFGVGAFRSLVITCVSAVWAQRWRLLVMLRTTLSPWVAAVSFSVPTTFPAAFTSSSCFPGTPVGCVSRYSTVALEAFCSTGTGSYGLYWLFVRSFWIWSVVFTDTAAT